MYMQFSNKWSKIDTREDNQLTTGNRVAGKSNDFD